MNYHQILFLFIRDPSTRDCNECVLIFMHLLALSIFSEAVGCTCRGALNNHNLNAARLLSVRSFKTQVDERPYSAAAPKKLFDASCDPSDGHDHGPMHDHGNVDTETAHEWVSFTSLSIL